MIRMLLLVTVLIVLSVSEYAVIANVQIINIPVFVYHLAIVVSLIYIIWNIRRCCGYLLAMVRKGCRKCQIMFSVILDNWIKKLIIWNNRIKPFGKGKEFHQKFLTPVEDGDGVYSQLIYEAVCDKNVQNIAITGPYGSGKSSIIRSFQKTHPEYKYLNLSLANFQEQIEKGQSKDEGKLTTEENQLVELSILQQMFYQVKRKRIPDSRFKRINRLSKWACLLYTFLIFLWFLALTLVFKIELDIVPFLWLQSGKFVYVVALLYFILGIIIALKYTVRLVNRSHFKALRIEKCGMEISGDNEVSILNKHLDEILYYFEVTKFNVVIIEDLDRFERCSIFTKLRELNTLINKSEDIHRRVVFIYAIKDDMFRDKERTKFFDYILPVIPYINKSNSAGKFIQLFETAGFMDEINKTFLEEISIFVDDMRLLNNIFNEYEVYRRKLSGVLNYNKLLAIIVYKNACPKDFSDLHFGEGSINKIFEQKGEIIERKKEEVLKKIDGLRQKIERAKQENLLNEKELRMLVLGRFKMKRPDIRSLYNGSDYVDIEQFLDAKNFELLIDNEVNYCYTVNGRQSYGISFSDLEKWISPDFSYKERLANFQNRLKSNSDKIKSEIETCNQEIRSFSKCTYAQLADEIDETTVKMEKDRNLIRFLLLNGYIDEDYYYYISFFHQGDITPEDRKFIEVLKSGGKKPYAHHLSQIESIIKQLRLSDFDRPGIVNLDLLGFLLNNEQSYPDQTDSFLKQLRSKEHLPFIIDFVEAGVNADKLILWLCRNWEKFWKCLLSDGNLTEEKEKEYWVTIFNIVDEENIIRQNAVGWKMVDFINELTNFFELSAKVKDQKKLCALMDRWDISIGQVDKPMKGSVYSCLLKGHHYSMNYLNIRRILLFEVPDLTENDMERRNYTSIINSGCTELIDYINSDINLYVEKVNLGLEQCDQESEEAFLLLLNNDALKQENKHLLIKKNHCIIENLSKITDKTLWTLLLEKELIEVKWDNVIIYWEENGFDTSLNELLNKKWIMEILVETDPVNLSKEFVVEFVENNELNYNTFKTYMDSACPKFIPADISGMPENKILYLIENQMLELNVENYDLLKTSYPEMSFEFIKNNAEKYLEEYESYELSDLDIKKVCIADFIRNIDKLKILKIVDIHRIEGNTNLCNLIANVLSDNEEEIEIDDTLIEVILQKDIPVKQKVMIVAHRLGGEQVSEEILEKYLDILDQPYSLLYELRKTVELDELPFNRKLIYNLKNKRIIRDNKVKDGKIVVGTRWNR